jgi:hypothetical protein
MKTFPGIVGWERIPFVAKDFRLINFPGRIEGLVLE